MNLLYCFFFSSRRRHTRCLSDWSSDVCSSDLYQYCEQVVADAWGGRLPDGVRITSKVRLGNPPPDEVASKVGRSEERRVGKGVGVGGSSVMNTKNKLLRMGEVGEVHKIKVQWP